MRRKASQFAALCLLVPAYGWQLADDEQIKFNVLSKSSGVTKSGASWEGTVYETAKHARVQLTIVHLDSRAGAKNEYADWLKQKAVRIISERKFQIHRPAKSTTTESRAVAQYPVASECNQGTAIFATAGTALRIIQSCSASAAFEFEKQDRRD
jgi:hypothetical protein